MRWFILLAALVAASGAAAQAPSDTQGSPKTGPAATLTDDEMFAAYCLGVAERNALDLTPRPAECAKPGAPRDCLAGMARLAESVAAIEAVERRLKAYLSARFLFGIDRTLDDKMAIAAARSQGDSDAARCNRQDDMDGPAECRRRIRCSDLSRLSLLPGEVATSAR